MRYGSVENHLVRSYDYYFSWGSPHEYQEKVEKMPSLRLMGLKNRLRKINPDGQILLMATSMPRYKVFVESGIAGKHMLSWIDFQRQFLSSISSDIYPFLVWRYFNQLWEETDILKEEFPRLKVQHGRKKELGKKSDFITEVLKSRLTIHTANETTYLECMAANHPTLLYWPNDCYQIKDSVKKYFDVLVKAEILFYDPIKAAIKLNEIYENPSSWWWSNDVQDARKYFCDNIAYISDDYLKIWNKKLKSFIKK